MLNQKVMKEDIVHCKNSGVDGVVIGILNANGDVDVERTKELVELARPMKITFHRCICTYPTHSRAFDMCKDPFKSLEDIISLGIERILTSGKQIKRFQIICRS